MSQITDKLYVPDDVVGFVRAMTEWQDSDFDVVYFLEKPWKWESDFSRWKENGRPMEPNADGWAAFASDDG